MSGPFPFVHLIPQESFPADANAHGWRCGQRPGPAPAGLFLEISPVSWDGRAGASIVWTPPAEGENLRLQALSQSPRMERNRSFQH
jgi:hypothetical protein